MSTLPDVVGRRPRPGSEGEGNRPFFGKLSDEDVLLGNPSVCVQGDRVTHLVFPVVR